MSSHHTNHNHNFSNIKQSFDANDTNHSDTSLDKTFEKMEKLGIPTDLFGNINQNWRTVMKHYYETQNQADQQTELSYQKAIQKIGIHCQNKYAQNQENLEDCHEQAQLRILNHFQKPKELSEILLCNFANKCLIRGNTVEFCIQEVMKERTVINRECFKRLEKIEEYL